MSTQVTFLRTAALLLGTLSVMSACAPRDAVVSPVQPIGPGPIGAPLGRPLGVGPAATTLTPGIAGSPLGVGYGPGVGLGAAATPGFGPAIIP